MNTVNLNVKIDSNLKKDATEVLNSLGLNMSTAIIMFLTQVVKKDAIPFEIANPKPNRELRSALKEADAIINGKKKVKSYKNVDDLFNDILK